MKIVAISDTHCQLSDLIKRGTLPPGDLLLHSGDATYKGTHEQIFEFNEDLGKIKNNYTYGIVFTPGNHDIGFQDYLDASRLLMTNATLLIDEAVELGGLKIYGSPWQPWFYSWAYNFPERVAEGRQAAIETWAKIPDDTNILITHGPPKNILDRVPGGERVGCPHLRERILDLKQLKLHVFGHIHCGHGITLQDGVLFANAATCSEEYRPLQPPIVIHL